MSEAWAAVGGMVDAFVARLPYLLLAVVVFLLFYFGAKGVRAGSGG